MKRTTDRTSVDVRVTGNDTFWWEALTSEQRNSIRDRVDSICDDLNDWVPA